MRSLEKRLNFDIRSILIATLIGLFPRISSPQSIATSTDKRIVITTDIASLFYK